jgi:D-alanyl-D-alanine carboxypeptidase
MSLQHRLFAVLLILPLAACSTPTAPPSATIPATVAILDSPTSLPTPVAPTAEAIVPTLAVTAASATATLAQPTALPEPTAEPSATAAPAALDPALAGELQRILDQLVADGSIPGAVLSVSVDGSAPWLGAAGVADRGQAVAMTPETRVRIASISKIFTAVAVLQLIEEGTLTLDTTVEERLPGLMPNGAQLTVRRLLNHTTGLYDYLEDSKYLGQAYAQPDKVFSPQELVTHAAKNKSLFAPGTAGRWDYSSTNFVLLGMLIEQATGQPMAATVRQNILTPLGMTSTYFTPQEAVEDPQARGYSRGSDVTNVAMSFSFATASIVSTVGDLQKFATGLFAGQLLTPESQAQMQEFINGKGQYNMPALEYGFGLMRNQIAGLSVMGHIGGFGGFRSALWHAPEANITVALGVNQGSTDPNLLATQVFTAIQRLRANAGAEPNIMHH